MFPVFPNVPPLIRLLLLLSEKRQQSNKQEAANANVSLYHYRNVELVNRGSVPTVDMDILLLVYASCLSLSSLMYIELSSLS